MAQELTKLYGADIQWADENTPGEDQNHARLFELTPSSPGRMVATIGTGSGSLYRVDVETTLDETNRFGTLCVHRASDGSRIRCDRAGGDPVPVRRPAGRVQWLDGVPPEHPVADRRGAARISSSVPTEALVEELARRFPLTHGGAGGRCPVRRLTRPVGRCPSGPRTADDRRRAAIRP